MEVHGGVLGETFGSPAAALHPVDVEISLQVAREHDESAVRRPVRLEVVGRSRILRTPGELAGLSTGRRNRPEAPVEGEGDLTSVG